MFTIAIHLVYFIKVSEFIKLSKAVNVKVKNMLATLRRHRHIHSKMPSLSQLEYTLMYVAGSTCLQVSATFIFFAYLVISNFFIHCILSAVTL